MWNADWLEVQNIVEGEGSITLIKSMESLEHKNTCTLKFHI